MRYLKGCGRLLLALRLTRGLKSSQVKALIAFTSPIDLTQSSDREGCSAAEKFWNKFSSDGTYQKSLELYLLSKLPSLYHCN